MTLAGSEIAETLPSGNSITTVISDSVSDLQNLSFYEGHTISGTNLVFNKVTETVTLSGRNAVTLPLALGRSTRARLVSPADGNIYFYEGGATTNGQPDDDTTVHLIIPAGEIQSQKASTAVSYLDYWFIGKATISILSKVAAWGQARIEIKPFGDTYFYPITQWVGVSDSSGTIPIVSVDDEYLVVPKDHDVRIAAFANTANIKMAGGMEGPLGLVV